MKNNNWIDGEGAESESELDKVKYYVRTLFGITTYYKFVVKNN